MRDLGMLDPRPALLSLLYLELKFDPSNSRQDTKSKSFGKPLWTEW